MAEALLSMSPERTKELETQTKLDAWYNSVTGFGTAKDKTVYGTYSAFYPLDLQKLSDLYHGDAMAARMVDVVPQEMLREGFSADVGDPKVNDWLSDKFRDLDARAKLQDGERWGSLFGGSALLVGADDGRPASMLLIPERAKAVSYLYVLDRRMLWPFSYYSEPGHPKLGQPETYLVTPASAIAGQSQVVHESRLIIFRGAPTGLREKVMMNGWDYSILQRPYEVLRQYNTGWNSLEIMMTDGNQAVFTMSGLAQIISAGGLAAVQARMAAISLFRSNLNAMVVDAGDGSGNAAEKFERQQLSYEGIPQALDKLMLRLASAVQIPVTILMGQSPAGMSATGDSDFRWFYDRIRAKQTNELGPKLRRLIQIILATKESPLKGGADSITVHFPSLWKETPKDEAARRLANAQADAAYINAGALLPEEVALARFGGEAYGDDIRLTDEAKAAREDGLEIELDDIATKPEPVVPDVVDSVDTTDGEAPSADAGPKLDSDDQERDEAGRFSGSGGGGGSGGAGKGGSRSTRTPHGRVAEARFSRGAVKDGQKAQAEREQRKATPGVAAHPAAQQALEKLNSQTLEHETPSTASRTPLGRATEARYSRQAVQQGKQAVQGRQERLGKAAERYGVALQRLRENAGTSSAKSLGKMAKQVATHARIVQRLARHPAVAASYLYASGKK